MNRIALLLSLLAFGWTGCQRTEPASETEAETPPEAAATPEASQTAEVAPPPATAPETPQFAPEGVFFLLTPKSIESADGVVGFPAGTEIRKQADGTFLVGRQTMALRPDEVTNDLRVVRQIAAANQAAQTARAAQLAAQEKALRDAAEKAKKAAASKAKVQPRPVAAATPPPQKPLGSVMDGPTQRVKDGYYWKKNAAGEWEMDRPVRN